MNHYLCTIYNRVYFQDQPTVRLGRVGVVARNRREAAARAYVRTVGRARVRFLVGLNAPTCGVLVETRWRTMARALARVSNGLGDCFQFDTGFENFYILPERLPVNRTFADVVTPRVRRRGRLQRAAKFPCEN